MRIQLFKLLNSLARQGVLSPLNNGKTQTYPRGSDKGSWSVLSNPKVCTPLVPEGSKKMEL